MPFDGSLASWLREQPRSLSLDEVVLIVRKAADALQQVHDQRRIYQDVNPSNFIIQLSGENTGSFNLKLADLSAMARASIRFGSSYPANSQLMYMAPEQWVGHAGPATDQYALAVLAYELLTGLSPFQGPPAQLLDLHTNVQPPAPSTLNQRVSPAVDAVILTALAKRPEDRFASAPAFARALEQAVRRPEPQTVSIQGTTADGNLRATLLINKTEATTGALRTITLPHGRRITVAVPGGAYDGQLIRLEGFGDPSAAGGATGSVLLSIAVNPTETNLPSIDLTQRQNTGADLTQRQHTGADLTQRQHTGSNFTPSIFANPGTIATRARTSVSNLTLRGRAVLLACLVIIVLLAGVGVYSLVQSTASVPIPYPPNSGSLALNDLLRDNTRGYNWPDGTTANGGTCQFMQGAYHVSVTKVGAFHYCIAGAAQYSNFAYEVHMTIIKGDGGGVIFRADGANNKFYYFRVGRDGSYGLYLYVDGNGSHAKTLVSDMSAAIHTGLNVPNLLAVVARGSTINLYVNNVRIATVNDSTYNNGEVGVAAAYLTDLTEVAFNGAKVWTV